MTRLSSYLIEESLGLLRGGVNPMMEAMKIGQDGQPLTDRWRSCAASLVGTFSCMQKDISVEKCLSE